MNWETHFATFMETQLATADAAHDMAHIRRVVATAKRLAAEEAADLAVVVPSAWLHDCIAVPKDSPERARASTLAAEAAVAYLVHIGYPEEHHEAIAHAISAHSFSAGIPPRTREAQVVQDADRLDSLGAIGLARCLLTGVSMGTAVYHPTDPFGESGRALDDKAYSVDHFYVKLLKLAGSMQTASGRAEAARRTAYLEGFLEQLRWELGVGS
ncbi:MAG: HD domain-containing protein [Chloroflexi bacterium]|nr:HD domain-containing protein [Chloroflexota bacterium]